MGLARQGQAVKPYDQGYKMYHRPSMLLDQPGIPAAWQGRTNISLHPKFYFSGKEGAGGQAATQTRFLPEGGEGGLRWLHGSELWAVMKAPASRLLAAAASHRR